MDFEHILDDLYLQLNQIRLHPRQASAIMSKLSNQYNGKLYKNTIKTRQGSSALYNLINDLNSRSPLQQKLKWSYALHLTADQQARLLGYNGLYTTQGTNFFHSLPDRVKQHAIIKGKLSQIYQFGGKTSHEILEQLLIDDGLASRKRRTTLLDPIYKYIGIGSSYHQNNQTCTVIVLAQNIISLVAPDQNGKYKRKKGIGTGKQYVHKQTNTVVLNNDNNNNNNYNYNNNGQVIQNNNLNNPNQASFIINPSLSSNPPMPQQSTASINQPILQQSTASINQPILQQSTASINPPMPQQSTGPINPIPTTSSASYRSTNNPIFIDSNTVPSSSHGTVTYSQPIRNIVPNQRSSQQGQTVTYNPTAGQMNMNMSTNTIQSRGPSTIITQPPLIQNQHGSVVTYQPSSYNYQYIPSPNTSQLLNPTNPTNPTNPANSINNLQTSGTFNTANNDEANRLQQEQYQYYRNKQPLPQTNTYYTNEPQYNTYQQHEEEVPNKQQSSSKCTIM